MDRETDVLRMSSPTGDDAIHMGVIASSSARVHKLLFRVENTSETALNVLLLLSEPLAHVLSLLRVAPQASQSEKLTPVNHVNSRPNSITVQPYSVAVYELQLTIQNAWKRDISHVYPYTHTHNKAKNGVPFSGQIVAVNVKTSIQVGAVHLSGTCCESWLQPHMCVLHFAHCMVANWTYRDLSVRNKSKVATAFSISVGLPSIPNRSSDSLFRFIDPLTGSELNPDAIRLDGLSTTVVRVGLLASKEGSEEYWLSVQNLENADNFWHVRVLASPEKQLVAHGIHISCGDTLNFGDCYAYCSTFKEIHVRNNYSEAVNVALLSDSPDEISYEVAHDWSKEPDQHIPMSSQDHLDVDGDDKNEVELGQNADNQELPPDVVELLNGHPSSGEHAKASDGTQAWLSGIRGATNPISSHGLSSESVDDEEPLVDENQPQFEDNISLRPGQARNLRVWYIPKMLVEGKPVVKNISSSSNQSVGKLQEKQFQLLFALPSGERRIVSCSSRVCESNVQLEQSEVHLGNCNLLTTYTSAITLVNCSDMPAALSIHYVSRCVVAASHDISIEPREKHDLNLRFVPLHVNPRYHKEISITNERNPNAQRMVFTLRANCVDRRGISFHALFYKILAPEPTNEIDIGVVVANYPTIRAFRIRNETQQRLVLRFENFRGVSMYASNEQISASVDSPESSQHNPRIKWKDSLPSIPGVVRLWANDPTFAPRDPESRRTSLAILDPGIGGTFDKHGSGCLLKRDMEYGQEDSSGPPLYSWTENENHGSGAWERRKPLQDLIKCLDAYELSKTDSIPTFFENHDAEKHFADKMFRPVQLWQAALADGCLCETDVISMEPEAQCIIVISLRLTDKDVRRTTKLRVIERRMKIRMLEFDQERLGALETEDPKRGTRLRHAVEAGEVSMEREVPLTIRACKSAMSISPLTHLNFGIISVGEQRDKAFNIVNLSETPLLYEIRKSGAPNSRDLRFNLGPSFHGAISPYYTKVVPFIYAPTVEGKFEERIVVKNRLDESADREIVVKAIVVKSRIIWDESDEDD